MLENLQNWYRELPDKKKYVELVSAVLSVPVMVTVILINMNNLTQRNAAKSTEQLTPSHIPSVTIILEEKIITPTPQEDAPTPTINTSATPSSCVREVGPITISSPRENEVITGSAVNIRISEQPEEFCPLLWSYSLDEGTWTDYSDNDISIYNLPTGNHTINIRVRSIASENEITLRRTFYYNNPSSVTLTPVLPATTSALTQ